jgi:hypothetical protein
MTGGIDPRCSTTYDTHRNVRGRQHHAILRGMRAGVGVTAWVTGRRRTMPGPPGLVDGPTQVPAPPAGASSSSRRCRGPIRRRHPARSASPGPGRPRPWQFPAGPPEIQPTRCPIRGSRDKRCEHSGRICDTMNMTRDSAGLVWRCPARRSWPHARFARRLPDLPFNFPFVSCQPTVIGYDQRVCSLHHIVSTRHCTAYRRAPVALRIPQSDL